MKVIIFYNPQLLEQFQKVNLKEHQMLSVKTRSHENSSQKILDYQILDPIQLIFRHVHYILKVSDGDYHNTLYSIQWTGLDGGHNLENRLGRV